MQLRHENLVQMVDMFVSGGDGGPGDVYIVTEVMDCDLGALVNSPWGCPYELHSEHVQFILYQMVRGLKYIHSAEVTTPSLSHHHPPHLSLTLRYLLPSFISLISWLMFGLPRLHPRNLPLRFCTASFCAYCTVEGELLTAQHVPTLCTPGASPRPQASECSGEQQPGRSHL